MYNNEEEKKKARYKSIWHWQQKNTRNVTLRYNLNKDKVILDKLDSVVNKGDYVRQLILKDVEKDN